MYIDTISGSTVAMLDRFMEQKEEYMLIRDAFIYELHRKGDEHPFARDGYDFYFVIKKPHYDPHEDFLSFQHSGILILNYSRNSI